MAKEFQQRQLVLAERTKYRKKQQRRAPVSSSSFQNIAKFLLRLAIFPIYLLHILLEWLFVEQPWDAIDKVKQKLERNYLESKEYYEKSKGVSESVDDDDSKSMKSFKRSNSLKRSKSPKKPKKRLIKASISKLVHFTTKLFLICKYFINKLYNSKAYLMTKLKWSIKKFYELWKDTELIFYKIKRLTSAIMLKIKSFLSDAVSGLDGEIELPQDASPSLDRTPTPYDTPSPPGTIQSRQNCKFRPPVEMMFGTNDEVNIRFEDSMRMKTGLADRPLPLSKDELIDSFFNNYDALDERPKRRSCSNRTTSASSAVF